MRLPEAGTIHVGPSGWAHAGWQGLFYPTAPAQGPHRLEFLSRYFNSVEVTASLYGPLKPELSKLWASLVSKRPDFQFSVRCWRKLVEEGSPVPADFERFREGLMPLVEKRRLGALLLEFPSTFRFNPMSRARLVQLRREFAGLPLVGEFRHSSWMCEEALGTLIDHQIGFCNLDQPEHSRAMPPTAILTATVGYVRLRGRNAAGISTPSYLYTEQQLDGWVHRIRKVSRFAKHTIISLANDTGTRSLVNAFQLQHRLGLGSARIPKELLQQYRQQLQVLATPVPAQESLFEWRAA